MLSILLFFPVWFIFSHASKLIESTRFFNPIKKYLIRNSCIYRITSDYKEKDEQALYEYDHLDLYHKDVKLNISDTKKEIKPIIDIMTLYPEYFFIDQIDYLVITKMGFEVIKIKFPNRDKNRSLFLEFLSYKDNSHITISTTSFLLAVLVAILAENYLL